MKALTMVTLACCLVSSNALASLSVEQQLGSCRPEMVAQAFDSPVTENQFRAVITRLYGVDEQSRNLGMQVGRAISQAFLGYAKKSIVTENTGITASNVHVKFIPCVIADHEEARKLGAAAKVDVVLWGTAFCDLRNPKQCAQVNLNLENAKINSDNQAQDSPNSSFNNEFIIKINGARNPKSGFKISLTVASYLGLEADTSGLMLIRRNTELAEADLPRLTSSEPRLLLDFVLGIYSYRAGYYGLAASLFRRSAKSVSAGVEGISELYRMMGRSYVISGEQKKGLAALERAFSLCDPRNDRCRGIGMNERGWAEHYLNMTHDALEHFDHALRWLQKTQDRAAIAATMHNMGLLYQQIGDIDEALPHYEKALPLWRQSSNFQGEAQTLNNIALIYEQTDPAKSLEYYKKALSIWKLVDDIRGSAHTLNNIGNNYEAQGRITEALDNYQAALPLLQQSGDHRAEARTLSNIGRLLDTRGERKQAIVYYEKALPIMRRLKDHAAEITTLHHLGDAYSSQRDAPKAIECYLQALPYIEKLQTRGVLLNNLGAMYYYIGNIRKALPYFIMALPIVKHGDDVSSKAIILNSIASAYSRLGNFKFAEKFHREALAFLKQTDDRAAEQKTLDAIAANSMAASVPVNAIDKLKEELRKKAQKSAPKSLSIIDEPDMISPLELALIIVFQNRQRAQIESRRQFIDVQAYPQGMPSSSPQTTSPPSVSPQSSPNGTYAPPSSPTGGFRPGRL